MKRTWVTSVVGLEAKVSDYTGTGGFRLIDTTVVRAICDLAPHVEIEWEEAGAPAIHVGDKFQVTIETVPTPKPREHQFAFGPLHPMCLLCGAREGTEAGSRACPGGLR